jgi:outer membrane immunogenic protein
MKLTVTRAGIALAALLVTSIAAQAADIPRKSPAYSEPVAPYMNWSGFYVGLNAGYAFGKSDWDVPAVSPSPKGFVGGLTLGYNYQTGVWLWGVEGDINWSNVKGSADCAGGTCETKNDWLATARARIGYTGWNGWLPYITGGAAAGDIKATNSLAGSASKTKIGWTAGAGLEWAFWSNWSLKGEYLYVDLGKMDCGIACGAASDNVSFKTHLLRAGLNYRF